MIKVTECGKKGCTVEFHGMPILLAQEYAALTIQIAEHEPLILSLAQRLIEEATKNGKTDKCND